MLGMNCRECGRRPGGAYLTAYQIALKYGFKGTEEQWIKSIGTMRSIHVTEESGGTFECDASLGQVLQMMEDGFIPVLITTDGLPAFLSGVNGEVLSFSTSLIRDIEGDYYDCYSISGREKTVQKMTVTGSQGGGGSIGPGSITYSLLNERLQEAIQSAESAVQPEDIPVVKGYASMTAYVADSENVRVGDYVLITDTNAKLYRKTVLEQETVLKLLYTFPTGSGPAPEPEDVDWDDVKPEGGITIYDLANDVQQSLHRGDDALPAANYKPQTLGIGIAQSTTQGGTVPKTASLADYVLKQHGLLAVRFTTPVEAGATLSVTPDNGETYTTAKPIYDHGSAITTGRITYGDTALFVFDGTNFNLLCVDASNKNYGTANVGKPLVVGQDGMEIVGNWPVPGEGGEPVTWADIVPPDGIRQTDIAKLTVEFTENQQWTGYNASTNLTAVMAALAANKVVDCVLGDYHGELIYAHADGEDSGNEFAIFKILEQVETYHGMDGEERLPQVRMFYMTHVGVTYQVNAIGGACYVFVTEAQGVYDIDTVNTSKTAQSVQGLLTAFYVGIETRMIVRDGYYNWSHPVSYHYGQAEIRFAGPEAVTVNGRTEIRMVEYTINSSSHVGRTVGSTLPAPASGEPLNPSADKGKTPEVDEYGRYVLVNGGMRISAPGSGYSGKVLKASGEDSASWDTVREVPEGASGDNGKYLKNVNGTPTWSAAPSGGSSLPATSNADADKGLFVDGNGDIGWAHAKQITITVNNGSASLNMPFAELLAALQAGRPAHVYAPGSDQYNIVEVYPVKVNQSANSIVFVGDTFNEKFAVTLVQTNGQMIGAATVGPSGNVRAPSVIQKTAQELDAGISIDGNRIYEISGAAYGFEIINSGFPTIPTGQGIEIRLTVGSSAITTPTWPGWATGKFVGGFDGTFAPNTYYDVIIDDVGNIGALTREVSA